MVQKATFSGIAAGLGVSVSAVLYVLRGDEKKVGISKKTASGRLVQTCRLVLMCSEEIKR